MRNWSFALLSLSLSVPAFAEPPTARPESPTEAVTDAPLRSESYAAPRESMPPTRVAGIAVTSVGAALTAVGLGFAIAAADAGTPSAPSGDTTDSACGNVLDDTCMQSNGGASLDGSAEDFSIVAAVGLGVGLAAVTTGVILIAVPGPEVDPAAPSVALELGAGRIGVSGRF